MVIRTASADKAFEDYTVQTSTAYHTIYKHGWVKGNMETNKVCGITFLVKRSLTAAVKKHIQPPTEHRGRLAGIRLRTAKDDVTVIAVYAPCYGNMKTNERQARLEKMTTWIDNKISKMPSRTIPIVAGDLKRDLREDK